MDSYDVLESNCVQFIEAIQKVEVKAIEYNRLITTVYYTSYNGYFKVDAFFRDLSTAYRSFNYELQHLPLKCASGACRKLFLTNLHHHLLQIRMDAEETYKTEIQHQFNYLYLGKEVILKRFPDTFSELLYSRKVDYENHKIHFMYHAQYRIINRAIDLVLFYAGNEGLDLSMKAEDQDAGNQTQTNRKKYSVKTSLTVAQVSHFMDVVTEVVAEGSIPKSELAMFVSDTFETSRTRKPSKRQVYKSFYDVDESTRKVVKDLVIEMLNRVKN